MPARDVLVSLEEYEHLRDLIVSGGVAPMHEDAKTAVILGTLLRERLLRVIGGHEVATSAGHDFVRCAVISSLTVTGLLHD